MLHMHSTVPPFALREYHCYILCGYVGYKLNVVYYFDYWVSESVLNGVGMGRTGTISNDMYGEKKT